MRRAGTVLDQVTEVVGNQNCSGCGACVLIDPRLAMGTDTAGFARPVVAHPDASVEDESAASAEFRRVCPGVTVRRESARAARVDPLFGPWIGVWRAHATDPDIRHRGSSGGVITALAGYLLETGQVGRVLAAGQDARRPMGSTDVTATSADEVRPTAGSRYAPVSIAANTTALAPDSLVVAKPCEASALRELNAARDLDRPLTLSFFCAGVPSRHATERLVQALGVAAEDVAALRYRGHGWPGAFTVRDLEGNETSCSYQESWGDVLGKAVQWRCKICPDGVGEASDITAGDFWDTDERGYPTFADAPGQSVLISRTPRGHSVVLAALAAGAIAATPADIADLAAVQPLQTSRRRTLRGRLLGARIAGRSVPRYVGFPLTRLGLANSRASLRAGRGTYARVRCEARMASEEVT